MGRERQTRFLVRWGIGLLVLTMATGCAGGSLLAGYIDTARFVDERPTPQTPAVLQIEVKPFENQVQDRTRVGTKRVGVNEINGPLLATGDVASVLQKSVITQLGLKGIAVGSSTLRLQGTVHDFFVDVDVDPASGRGKFHAVVRVALEVFDKESQRQLWHETYTGTASASAPSVVDSAYENTLKVAFTNLLNQIRQDESLLELRQLDTPAPSPPAPSQVVASQPLVSPPSAPSPPPSLPPVQPEVGPGDTTPRDITPPRIVFLSPVMRANAREITTVAQVMRVSGLVLGTDEVEKLRVEGATKVEKAPASAQALREARVEGPGIEFKAFVFLTPGVNRLQFHTVDRQGHPQQESLTIQRQLDTTPPRLVTAAVVVQTSRPRQLISGLVADESGVAEVQINGVTAQMTTASPQDLQEAGLSGTGVKFAGYAELQSGTNQVEVKAIDRHQNVQSQVFTVQRQELARAKIEIKQLYPRSVGVVIGIDAYSSWPRLTYAVQGAKEVQKALKASGFDEVIEVLDKEATHGRLLQLFETELPGKVGKNDRVVIFFAGQAQTLALADGTQMGYLIPVDASRQDVVSTAISMTQLRSAAKRLPAKHIFYATDASYAGLVSQRGLSIQPAPDQDTLSTARHLVAQPTTQLLAAARQGEQVGLEGGQSLFTKYLILGLQGEADTNNDRLVTVTELASYLMHQVAIASDNRQTPQYEQIEGEGDVAFVY